MKTKRRHNRRRRRRRTRKKRQRGGMTQQQFAESPAVKEFAKHLVSKWGRFKGFPEKMLNDILALPDKGTARNLMGDLYNETAIKIAETYFTEFPTFPYWPKLARMKGIWELPMGKIIENKLLTRTVTKEIINTALPPAGGGGAGGGTGLPPLSAIPTHAQLPALSTIPTHIDRHAEVQRTMAVSGGGRRRTRRRRRRRRRRRSRRKRRSRRRRRRSSKIN